MPITMRLAFPAAIMLLGAFFSWRLLTIPSRLETAIFMIVLFLVPTLKFPKFGVYYLFCVPFLIPLFRRMYYLVSERPNLDYLMLISDGVMGGFICALLLLWLLNKERSSDLFPKLVIAYTALLFLKVFIGAICPVIEGLYGFKFNGLYVMFFFGGSYILTTVESTKRLYGFASWMLFFTSVYALKQILFGFSAFEQKWLDSITFTTIRIEGVVRPFSTYVSPAAMSDGMTILIAAGAYWFMSKRLSVRMFGVLLVASALAPLLIATVRTNWLAVMAGLFFYFVFLRIRERWAKVLLTLVLIAGMAGFLAKGSDEGSAVQTTAMNAQLLRKDKSISEIMITNRTRALANPLQEYSLQKRMETWGFIWVTSLKFPLGRGQASTNYAHSYYFQMLGEIGFPGLALFLTMLFLAFKRGLRIIALTKDAEMAEMTRFQLTILFMISLLNMTGTHLHTPPGDLFFWFGLGVIVRFHRLLEAELARAGGAP